MSDAVDVMSFSTCVEIAVPIFRDAAYTPAR